MLNSTKYAAIAIVGAGLAVATNAPASAYGGYYGYAGGYYGSAAGMGYGCICHRRHVVYHSARFWRLAYEGLRIHFARVAGYPAPSTRLLADLGRYPGQEIPAYARAYGRSYARY